MAHFIDADGLVHIANPIQAEFTLCGDAFDLGSHEDGYEWRATKRRTVTCDRCATIVRACRMVRTCGSAADAAV